MPPVSGRRTTTIINYLAAKPAAGVMIEGTGGARKVRFAGRGKGKSRGYRVITFYGGDDIPLFLLDVFAKGDKSMCPGASATSFAEGAKGLAEDYRSGVRRYVESR